MTDSHLIAPMCRRLVITLVGLLALILAHKMALIYRIQPGVSLWFPPSGVAIALTFWLGPYGIVLTGLASLLMSPFWGLNGWEQAIALLDGIEPFMAWLLYRRLWQGSLRLNSLRDTAIFTLSVPLAASATLAVVGSLAWVAIGKMPAASLAESIPHWWLGNAIGIMAIAPTALLMLTPYLQSSGWLPNLKKTDYSVNASTFPQSRRFFGEISIIIVFCVAIAALTVAKTNNTTFEFQQLSFLSFVPVLWAASRFGVTSGMVISSFCVLVTLLFYLIVYPNAILLPEIPVPSEILHVHKLSLLVQCAVALLVGTAITQRGKIQIALAVERVRLGEYQARAELSEKLIQLNDSLIETNARLQESNRDKDELLYREQALRQRLATILESMSDAFIAVNKNWEITYVNRQAAKITDLEPDLCKSTGGKNYRLRTRKSPWRKFLGTVSSYQRYRVRERISSSID